MPHCSINAKVFKITANKKGLKWEQLSNVKQKPPIYFIFGHFYIWNTPNANWLHNSMKGNTVEMAGRGHV